MNFFHVLYFFFYFCNVKYFIVLTFFLQECPASKLKFLNCRLLGNVQGGSNF